jgi:hypothetical protein
MLHCILLSAAIGTGAGSQSHAAIGLAMFRAPVTLPPYAVPAQAKSRGFEVKDVAAQPGQQVPLPIVVTPSEQAQTGLVMINGIPGNLSLSAGFRARDTWMVSVKDLAGLQLAIPPDFEGGFKIEVTLVLGKDSRERREATVAVAAPAAKAAAADSRPTAAPVIGEKELPYTASITSEEQRVMLERAVDQLRNGDVSAARLLFHLLADNGSPIAALSLARTYDPEVLPTLGVIGMRGDRAEAERWYKRAAELGSEPAARRLQSLASGK